MVRNFLFHRVNPERDLLWDPMEVAHFERCIRFISEKYKVILLEDFTSDPGLFVDDEIATICFDDGYKDNIEFAAPILDRYRCPASFYVVTDCIEHNMPTWTHMLEYVFQYTNMRETDIEFGFLPAELRVRRLDDKKSRLEYAKKLKPFLKTIPHEQRNEVIEKVKSTYTDVVLPQLMMNWSDLRQLRNAGHYVGSHTVSHCMLGTMKDETEVKFELETSRQVINKELGYLPGTISYPVGSYNENTKRLSREVGYKIGLAVKQTVYNPAEDDIFEIPRIELYNEPWWKTKMRISNRLEEIKQLIGYK